jgi:hypothetical protein
LEFLSRTLGQHDCEGARASPSPPSRHSSSYDENGELRGISDLSTFELFFAAFFTAFLVAFFIIFEIFFAFDIRRDLLSVYFMLNQYSG